MKNMIFAMVAALALASCGGGGSGDLGLSSAVTADALKGTNSPDQTLVAQPVSVANTTIAGDQVLRSIGATTDGGYTVAWISGVTLYLQHYDSLGIKQVTEVQVSLDIAAESKAATFQAILNSSVAVLADRSVVVVYRISRNTDLPNGTVSTTSGVYFQRFDANGMPLQVETEVASRVDIVNSRTPSLTTAQAIPLSTGGFVVSWSVAGFSAQFGSISTLSLRWFDSLGQPVGSPVEVGDFPALTYSIVPDTHGGFTLSTSQLDNFFKTEYSVFHYDAIHAFRQVVPPQFGPALLLPLEDGYVLFSSNAGGVVAQRLDAQGNASSNGTPISALPVAARELADGSYVVFWTTEGGFTLQRYAANETPIGTPLSIQAGELPQVVALADTGFLAAWSGPGAQGDTDVFTQQFIEQSSERKKECLQRARGLHGQERKAFMNACFG